MATHSTIDEFYSRVHSQLPGGNRITFSFTSTQIIDGSRGVMILMLKPSLPKFKNITKHVLGDIKDKRYKILWTINMVISKEKWKSFSGLTHKMSMYFTCETRDELRGERLFTPLFQMGKMMKKDWGYSLENMEPGNIFKWGSMKVINLHDEVLLRFVIEDVVRG
jgi:hypothetical protein